MARYRRAAPKKLASKMREVRLRLEMTQEQVAEYPGTDSGAVSRYERGLREPSLFEILAFSRMSGVGIEVLIDEAEPYQETQVTPPSKRPDAQIRPFGSSGKLDLPK